MSYTVVGMFPTNEEADHAANELNNSGFSRDDYKVSRYSTSGDHDNSSATYNFTEDKNTSGFWDWLFGDDEDERQKYSYAGSKSNIVTVYADDMEKAELARDIMNEQGAIDVNEFTKDRYQDEARNSSTDLSERERARIISKARNNLYFIDDTRIYTKTYDGMENDMDSQGNEN